MKSQDRWGKENKNQVKVSKETKPMAMKAHIR